MLEERNKLLEISYCNKKEKKESDNNYYCNKRPKNGKIEKLIE